MLSIASLLMLSGVLTQLPAVPVPSDVTITVLNTWELTFASDVQDITWCENNHQIVVRSNGDGVLYLLDEDCNIEGEIELPAGLDGFGVAYDLNNNLYFVNSASTPVVFFSDGSDSWTGFANPAGIQGAGMDIENLFSTDLCQTTSSSPGCLWVIDTGTFTGQSFSLTGITDEISGIMCHDILAGNGQLPVALIVTTRYGHEFFFFYESKSGYYLYDQEDCPLDVEESLGLAWKLYNLTVLWSWKGTDGKFYLSELLIPVFGGIEDNTVSVSSGHLLGILASPARAGAVLRVALPEAGNALLEVFDLSGRLVETLNRGSMNGGENLFSFDAPAGIYMARLSHPSGRETLRFVITE